MNDDVPDNHDLARQLRRLLDAIEVSGRAILPSSNTELLQSIVDAAANIFGAAAASISLIDEAEEVLEFKVAYGVGKEDVVGRRIPLNKGIAGFVAMTGQPIAISDVQQDPRFAQDFAKSTGYVPRSILGTPLISNDRVIGVMEVLDKIDAPSFGMQDMELLGVFANQAAIAINQSQQYDLLGEALIAGLQDLVSEEQDIDADAISRALTDTDESDETLRRDMLELARLINQLSSGGKAERKMCLQVLAAFGNYVQSQPRF
ncbi:MAG: GAF domain-containing protein [Anaerolineales bacterium]|nr:GAF domain-containing protein [Anaerolineales bacterium]